MKALSLDTLQRQIAERRTVVGDCLQLHQVPSATLESKVLENADVLRELLRLRSNGLVIGLTVTGPNQADVIRRAVRVSIDGANPFQVVQATWNLLERSAAPALAEAKDHGWGAIVKEALANGRLTDQADGVHLKALQVEAVARRATIDALAPYRLVDCSHSSQDAAQKSRRPANFGRPSRSTRTISSGTRTAILAISRALAGNCPAAPVWPPETALQNLIAPNAPRRSA